MLEIVLTSSESDQYSSARIRSVFECTERNINFPMMYMTGYFCRSVYYTIIDFNDLSTPKSDIHRGRKTEVNFSFKGR